MVYARPKPRKRAWLWRELREINSLSPWCIIGDFNLVLKSEEWTPLGRWSGCFQNMVNKNGLMDLGFIGPSFSWKHSTNPELWRSVRLDRALSYIVRHQRFPKLLVMHYPHSYSDHCPLLLGTHLYRTDALEDRLFWFDAEWLSDIRFMEFAEAIWKRGIPLHEAIKDFSWHVWKWKKRCSGTLRSSRRDWWRDWVAFRKS